MTTVAEQRSRRFSNGCPCVQRQRSPVQRWRSGEGRRFGGSCRVVGDGGAGSAGFEPLPKDRALRRPSSSAIPRNQCGFCRVGRVRIRPTAGGDVREAAADAAAILGFSGASRGFGGDAGPVAVAANSEAAVGVSVEMVVGFSGVGRAVRLRQSRLSRSVPRVRGAGSMAVVGGPAEIGTWTRYGVAGSEAGGVRRWRLRVTGGTYSGGGSRGLSAGNCGCGRGFGGDGCRGRRRGSRIRLRWSAFRWRWLSASAARVARFGDGGRGSAAAFPGSRRGFDGGGRQAGGDRDVDSVRVCGFGGGRSLAVAAANHWWHVQRRR
ncbi:hypothetical protein DFR70_102676 [Nocardia tenerifensis]|uniref:Uncharacterized protein n=1 Tax=Nocardia tenerifensis TaxID=228006 RepID=A0A318KCZ0_9NOCA|nr:hypothetical protein DFR70_102676 [Nocardia tenerifensis]